MIYKTYFSNVSYYYLNYFFGFKKSNMYYYYNVDIKDNLSKIGSDKYILYINVPNLIHARIHAQNREYLFNELRVLLTSIISYNKEASHIIINLSTYLFPSKWYGISSSCATNGNYAKCLPIILDSIIFRQIVNTIIKERSSIFYIIPNKYNIDNDITSFDLIDSIKIRNVIMYYPNDTLIDILLINNMHIVHLNYYNENTSRYQTHNLTSYIKSLAGNDIRSYIFYSYLGRDIFGPKLVFNTQIGHDYISLYNKFNDWIQKDDSNNLIDIFFPNNQPNITINIKGNTYQNSTTNDLQSTMMNILYARIDSMLHCYGSIPSTTIFREYNVNVDTSTYHNFLISELSDVNKVAKLRNYAINNIKYPFGITTNRGSIIANNIKFIDELTLEYNIIVLMAYCIPGELIKLEYLPENIITIFSFNTSPLIVLKLPGIYTIPPIELVKFAINDGMGTEVLTSNIIINQPANIRRTIIQQSTKYVNINSSSWKDLL